MQTPPVEPVTQPPHARRWIWIILGIIVVLLIAMILIGPRSRGTTAPNSSAPTVVENCQPPVFTADFTDQSLISSVGPLGGINVGSASRSYISIKMGADGQFPIVPVYAPIDSTLVGIYHKKANYGELGSRGEYRLEFDVGCGVSYALDHIAFVTDAIKQAGPESPSDESNVGNHVSIPVKAGETLGQTDGTKVAGTWDFYLFNQSKPATHINSARWESDHNKYADCPYDYFTPALKEQYYGKLALWDGNRPANLDCGTINHDVAGSAAGGWFQADATDMSGTHLFLWSTATMVEALIEIHEQSVERNNERFGFRTYTYTKKPEEMSVGDAVCYGGDSKYLYAQLADSNTLRTARGTGNCPATFPASDIMEWQR